MLLPALSLLRVRYLILLALFLTFLGWLSIPSSFQVSRHLPVPKGAGKVRPKIIARPRTDHPIDHLIERADGEFKGLLSRESKTLHEAAEAYRQRRGRQPPPGFDRWFAYASKRSAVIVEEFWDKIYDDLNPFWGVPAKQMREQANAFMHKITIRGGVVKTQTDVERQWMPLWQEMIESVASESPDVDLPVNVMDESRIVVPWEEINAYMEKEKESRKIVPANKLKREFRTLHDLDTHPLPTFDPPWDINGPYWQHAVVGCPPTSPARNVYIETDFTQPPRWVKGFPSKSYEGYVQNWTLAKSPCDHLELQGLHGTFVEPISIANTKTFFPLFGGSKLPMNNEILLPPAMYWTEDPFYSGGKDHGQAWKEKKDSVTWRGAASGGRNREDNWTRFQRHRFVSMVNATSVEQFVLYPKRPPPNFILPQNGSYDLSVRESGTIPTDFSDWIATWSDVAMVHLLCFPEVSPPRCPYTDKYFDVVKEMPMKEQYGSKYLPDIDGNSFSGRYRGFLGSTSMPIKATIYQEWHDSRLVPWKHFAPMDNTFIDIYGIVEYFVGNKLMALEGHDESGKNIAIAGKEWAEKVLRKEDMSIYVLRLLLEYARLCDDEREMMGWAEDGYS